jgi:IS5 family transposase
MDRCHLKGETGDWLHAVLCAAGYNLKWLLRMIAKKGVTFWKHLFLRLLGLRHTEDTQAWRGATASVRHWMPMLAPLKTSAPAQQRLVMAGF